MIIGTIPIVAHHQRKRRSVSHNDGTRQPVDVGGTP
jgi:hypothetical protein